MLVYENHCIWSQAVDVIWALFMFGRAVGLIWLSATYSPDKWTIDPVVTPGVQYGLLLPLSIVFALLAILDGLISVKVDLGILGRIKRIVYNIIGLLNWPTVIISVEAPILCGLFGSMIPIVPAYYIFRGFNLEACCRLHPNNTSSRVEIAQRRREFNSLIARIEGEQRNRQEVPPPSYLEVTAGQEDTRRNVEAYNDSLQTQRKVPEENSFPETARNPFDSESTENPFSSESIGNPFGLEPAGNPFDSEFARNPFDYDFNKIQKY
jgi:hypothetical protein